MMTIPYRRGSAAPLVIVLSGPDGEEVDITGLELQLRFAGSEACVSLDGVPEDGSYVFDLAAAGLEPRSWRASIYYRAAPEGWSYGGEFELKVEGGC